MTEAERHQKRLANFIRYNRVRIQHGKLVLYKAVRHDLGSWYMRNRIRRSRKTVGGIYIPGREVLCRRCNRDPKLGCAPGLHVSTYNFAKNFMRSAPVILRVLVDPEDVVCVPTVYYKSPSKIRVRRLYVDAIAAGKRKCTYDLSNV